MSPVNRPAAVPAARTEAQNALAWLPWALSGVLAAGLVAGAVVLLLLLIFILENTQRVKISYLGANGHLSLGVALLLAAVAGALITAMVGAARISQLRAHARRERRTSSA